MKNRSISLDVYFEDDHEDLKSFLKRLEKKYKIKTEVLAEIGPAGGNPYIRFSGPVKNLENFYVHDYCGEDTLEEALKMPGADSFEELLDEK